MGLAALVWLWNILDRDPTGVWLPGRPSGEGAGTVVWISEIYKSFSQVVEGADSSGLQWFDQKNL